MLLHFFPLSFHFFLSFLFSLSLSRRLFSFSLPLFFLFLFPLVPALSPLVCFLSLSKLLLLFHILFSPFPSISTKHTHTHTHTYIYIYIYILSKWVIKEIDKFRSKTFLISFSSIFIYLFIYFIYFLNFIFDFISKLSGLYLQLAN